MRTRIETTPCNHAKGVETCVWCAAKKHYPNATISKVVVNAHDGYAFATVDGINMMFEESSGGVWKPALRPIRAVWLPLMSPKTNGGA